MGVIAFVSWGLLFVGSAAAAAGGLDASFGSGGVATAQFTGSGDAYGIAIQPDGKIVAAGSGGEAFGLARFTAAGRLDSTFGAGGIVTTSFGGGSGSYAFANAVLLQPDGKIVAGGSAGSAFALARYDSDGSLDTSFGTGGKVTTAGGIAVRALLRQDDGKIVAVGSTGGAQSSFLLFRYTAAGDLDRTFGAGGEVTTPLGAANAYANAAILQPDGKIVAAGTAESGAVFALVRYTAQGALDPTFGTGGKVTTAVGTGSAGANALVLQANGKLVAGGDSSGGFSLVRYTAAGALDPGFGTGGKVTTAVGSGLTSLSALALQQNGKLLAAGFASNGSRIVPVLARYSGIGSLDTTFGSDGEVTTAIGSGDAFGNALALQGDGKIVVGGASVSGAGPSLVVARYLSGDVPTYTLSVAAAGAGEGVVTSRPAAISCGEACSADFAYGTRVTLTATTFYGSRFAGWSGDCSGPGSCTVTLDGDRAVTAEFDPSPYQTLTVATGGGGSGRVTSDPTGIDCGESCSTDFLYGTSVTLTAIPDAESSSFTGWSGACSGTGSCTVAMTAARSVTATFAQLPPKTLTVTVSGGAAYNTNSGETCDESSSPCTSSWSAGMSVWLWPVAADFLNYTWTGCTAVENGLCLVRMTQDRSVGLVFGGGSTLRGIVLDPDGRPLADSPVTVCSASGRCGWASSGAHGRFSVRVSRGDYNLVAGAPGGTFYVPASAGPVSLTGDPGDVQDVTLRLGPAPRPPPEGTTITQRGTVNGVPLVYWEEDPVGIDSDSCPGGSGSFEVVLTHSDVAGGQAYEGQVVRSGPMVETASGSGAYHGSFSKLAPLHGLAAVHVQIDCPNGSIDLIGFDVYVDPSGVVRDASTGRPVAGATVTLSRFSATAQDFVAVPNGSMVMSPSNRRNPDRTKTDGKFAWDVVAGLYRVTATAPGCSTAETEALAIPPPVTGLVLRLDCRPVLTTKIAGAGSGTVTSDPGGIHCSEGTCSGRFSAGSTVTLTATPAPGSSFTGWSGACTGSGTCTLRLASARSVTAAFAAVPQTLSVTTRGTGGGTVTSSPAGISCGSACSKGFAYGTSVTLTATPAAGSSFAGWSGACTGGGTCALTMTAAKSVTATFTAVPKPVKPQRCVVPKVKGKTLAAARKAIRHGHCRVGKVVRAYSHTIEKGRVIAQKPKAGKHLRQGAKVKLTVSKGERPHR